MNIPGDTLTALSRIKNRRKVKSGGNPEEFQPMDLQGGSADESSPYPPTGILPDLPGETSPQSYDARANEIVDPGENEPVDYYQLGSQLANMTSGAQEQQEFQAPPPKEQPMLSAGITGDVFKSLSDYFSPQKRQEVQQEQELMRQSRGPVDNTSDVLGAFSGYLSDFGNREESNKQLIEKAGQASKARQEGMDLDTYQQKMADEYGEKQQISRSEMQEAIDNPWEKAVYGATDTVMNTPELKAKVETYFPGVSDEQLQAVSNAEKAISDMQQTELEAQGEWNSQIQSMRDRIASNSTTDQDKLLIGLALAMPLIIAGIFGAEAGLMSLSGSAKGLADVYGQREKSIKEDEASIQDLTKLKQGSQLKSQELELKKQMIPSEIRKAYGEPSTAHLSGKKLMTVTDPTTGDEKTGVEISPNLVLDVDYATDKDELKEKRAEARDLNKEKEIVDKLQKYANRTAEIVTQIKDPSKFMKLAGRKLMDVSPGTLASFGENIVLDGKVVNSALALRQLEEDMFENRRKVQQIRAFNPYLADHMENIFANPMFSFASPEDLGDQTLRNYTDARDLYISGAKNRGFLEQPIIESFREKDSKIYDTLNKKAQRPKGKELKNKALIEEQDGI